MIIWAKLTQGNGRGTCCWITRNLIKNIYSDFSVGGSLFIIYSKDRRIK